MNQSHGLSIRVAISSITPVCDDTIFAQGCDNSNALHACSLSESSLSSEPLHLRLTFPFLQMERPLD